MQHDAHEIRESVVVSGEGAAKATGVRDTDIARAALEGVAHQVNDVSDLVVERPVEIESTVRGAALLAGAFVSRFVHGLRGRQMTKNQEKFEPTMAASARNLRLAAWNDAVPRTVRHGKA
jgi:glycerol kinase